MGTPYFDFSNKQQPYPAFYNPIDFSEREEPNQLQELMNQGSSPAIKQYLEYLTRIPKQEDYKPSILRRILAGMAGVSSGYFGGAERGVNAAQQINRTPYMNAMEEYQNQMPRFKEAMDIENSENTRKLALYKMMEEQRWKEDESRDRKFGLNTSRMGEERQANSPIFYEANGRRMVTTPRLFASSGGASDVGDTEGSLDRKASWDRMKAGFTNDRDMANLRFGFDKSLEGIRSNNRIKEWDYSNANKTQIFSGEDDYELVGPGGVRSLGGNPYHPNRAISTLEQQRAMEQAFKEIGMNYPSQVSTFFDAENKRWRGDRDPNFSNFVDQYTNWIMSGRKGKAPVYQPSLNWQQPGVWDR